MTKIVKVIVEDTSEEILADLDLELGDYFINDIGDKDRWMRATAINPTTGVCTAVFDGDND